MLHAHLWAPFPTCVPFHEEGDCLHCSLNGPTSFNGIIQNLIPFRLGGAASTGQSTNM